MNEREITKSLECCIIEHNCTSCPQYGERNCLEIAIKGVLALIESKNAEVDRLKSILNAYSLKYGTINGRMIKVFCASIDCEHNRLNKCIAKEINLSDGHIHTVHQGFKHIHECKTYKKSEYYKELEQTLQEFNNALKGGAEE